MGDPEKSGEAAGESLDSGLSKGAVFSYVSAEQRIAGDHPLWRIRAMTDAALQESSPVFDELYAAGGRPSIAPEKLLRLVSFDRPQCVSFFPHSRTRVNSRSLAC